MSTLDTATATHLFRTDPQRWLDVGAGEIAYRRIGTGPDVLFVHGFPVSGATFRTLLPDLAEHVTCHIIDLPGAGGSRFDAGTAISMAQHITSVRRVMDLLALDDVAVVGHDSGGLIARHALAGDPRLRALGLIATEQPSGLSWRVKLLLAPRHLPGHDAALGWAVAHPRVRRSRLVLGGAFADPALLDGEFDEFFLRPLHTDRARLDAAGRLLRSFDTRHVDELRGVHRRIDVPVQLVYGDRDPFFPLPQVREMVDTFSNAELHVVHGARLFVHEERPAEVARALLPMLTSSRS